MKLYSRYSLLLIDLNSFDKYFIKLLSEKSWLTSCSPEFQCVLLIKKCELLILDVIILLRYMR